MRRYLTSAVRVPSLLRQTASGRTRIHLPDRKPARNFLRFRRHPSSLSLRKERRISTFASVEIDFSTNCASLIWILLEIIGSEKRKDYVLTIRGLHVWMDVTWFLPTMGICCCAEKNFCSDSDWSVSCENKVEQGQEFCQS